MVIYDFDYFFQICNKKKNNNKKTSAQIKQFLVRVPPKAA